jgi:hypothetical protein
MFYIITKTSKKLDSGLYWTGCSGREWSNSLDNAYKFHNRDSASCVLNDLSFDSNDTMNIRQLFCA